MSYDGPEWLNINHMQSRHRSNALDWTEEMDRHVRRYMDGQIAASTAAHLTHTGEQAVKIRAAILMLRAMGRHGGTGGGGGGPMTTASLRAYTVDMMGHAGVVLRWNNVRSKGRYRFGIQRWPDLLGYDRWGCFWGIDIKNPATRDKPSEAQLEEWRLMGKSGCEIHIVASREDAGNLAIRARRPPEKRGEP